MAPAATLAACSQHQAARHCASARPVHASRQRAAVTRQRQQHHSVAAAAASAVAASGAAASSPHAISVQGVDLTFTGRGISKQVLNAACLDVPRGSFHMLLGANGCGKSTLLRVLAGLFRPDAGAVHVDAPCGFVFQNPDHQVVMPSVAADVAFGLGRYDLPPPTVHSVVSHALAQVGLAEYAERPTSSLSGGQKQRVAIAGALAECPRVLLLDELTTFLDYEDQENVLQCVRSIVHASRQQPAAAAAAGAASVGAAAGGGQQQQQGAAAAGGVTALWVTHRLEELEYADSVSYMEDGRIAFSGSPAEARAYLRRLGALGV